MGPVPVDIKDVKAGEHIVQVKAPGYRPARRTSRSPPGSSQIVKFDLNAEAPPTAARSRSCRRCPRPRCSSTARASARCRRRRSCRPGEHPSSCGSTGYKKFEQKVRVEAGPDDHGVRRSSRRSAGCASCRRRAARPCMINGMPARHDAARSTRSRSARPSSASRSPGFQRVRADADDRGRQDADAVARARDRGPERDRAARRAARPVVVRRAHAAARPLDGRLRRRLPVLRATARINVGAGKIAQEVRLRRRRRRAHDPRAQRARPRRRA